MGLANTYTVLGLLYCQLKQCNPATSWVLMNQAIYCSGLLEASDILDEKMGRVGVVPGEFGKNVLYEVQKRLGPRIQFAFSRRVEHSVRLAGGRQQPEGCM